MKRIHNRFKQKNSKGQGQLQIQEMAFMLVAVILLFGLVAMFGMAIFNKSIFTQMNRINDEKNMMLITNLADSPEFKCVGSLISKSNCIDGDKVISLLNKSVYAKFWSFKSLYVLKSSGFNKKEDELINCNLANYPDCDIIKIIDDNKSQNIITTSSYVAFCRKIYEQVDSYSGYTYDRCEIARIVGGYEPQNPLDTKPKGSKL